MIADELRRQADQFVDIVELQPKISRDATERAARETREPRHFLQRAHSFPRAANRGLPCSRWRKSGSGWLTSNQGQSPYRQEHDSW
jgi:hypothetical protein